MVGNSNKLQVPHFDTHPDNQICPISHSRRLQHFLFIG